jgi:hypothetical protein
MSVIPSLEVGTLKKYFYFSLERERENHEGGVIEGPGGMVRATLYGATSELPGDLGRESRTERLGGVWSTINYRIEHF